MELFYNSSSNINLFACLSATVFLCRVTGNLNRPNSAYDQDTRNVQCIHVCTLPREMIGSTTSVDVCLARERDNLVPRVLSRGDVSECTSQPPRSCSKYTSATTTTCRFISGDFGASRSRSTNLCERLICIFHSTVITRKSRIMVIIIAATKV